MIEKQTAIILLAGPSASGKTTTAKKADHSFEEIRKKCGTHFPGQFYKPREQLPFWKDGSTNFESIEGLDIEHFHRLMQQLWTQREADFPIFDFHEGRRREKTFFIFRIRPIHF